MAKGMKGGKDGGFVNTPMNMTSKKGFKGGKVGTVRGSKIKG
jgi:hypothetical protein